MHTGYSGDAFSTYEQLEQVADRQGLDFLISTEHNNLLALHEHKEGWHGHVLTLVGVESTREEGYLLGLNMQRYLRFSHSTDDYLSDVEHQGGFSLIAHPRNPRWSWRAQVDKRILGLEIVDLTDQLNTAPWPEIMTGVLFYPFNTPAALIQLYHRPIETLKMWDSENSRRSFVGIYAADMHQSLRVFGNHLARFPKAEDILPVAHDHVIFSTPFTGDLAQDKPLLYDAIKRGHIYIAVDPLEDATGFFFSARQGDKTAWMGDELPAGHPTDFTVTLPAHFILKDCVINVYHNGEKYASSADIPLYHFQAALSGSYRIEVEVSIPTFWGFKKRIVWIYTNPIYLR